LKKLQGGKVKATKILEVLLILVGLA
jgi:hypothetical protein